MTRKIIYIVVGAVAVAALVGLAWWWFFNRAQPQPAPASGSFGTAQNTASPNSLGGGTQTNGVQTSQGTLSYGNQTVYNPALGVVTLSSNQGSAVYTTSGSAGVSGSAQTIAPISVPGVVWLSGSPANATTNSNTATGGSTGTVDTIDTSAPTIQQVAGSGTIFTPLGINGINSANPTGGVLPNIGGDTGGTGSNGLGIAGAVIGAAAAGALSCGAAQLFHTSAAATGATVGAGLGVAVTGAAGAVAGPASAISVQTVDLGNYVAQGAAVSALGGILGSIKGGQTSSQTVDDFWSCITRTVAKIALDQITNSVVNWINSGFNGSPSFVTNPDQFFGNIADNAAGQFIKGSALSFLCSPFQLQIKIAVAQSYANQNAQSCTLTSVINNINNFMNGDFSSGGWAGMLAFTGTPTNNPYGAYAYASIGLNYTVQTAVGAQQRQLTLGNGFLDFTKNQNCSTTATPPSASASKSVTELNGSGADTGQTLYQVCDVVHTTPGHVIADALGATQTSTFTELDTAKSFDEIISALITQLVTRTLQGGLSNLSGDTGDYASNFYTPDQLQAQSDAQTLLVQMQGSVGYAQQFAGTEQGAISDIEAAQQQLNSLYNCWNNASQASSTNAGAAAQNALTASTTLNSLNTQINTYNTNITNANNGIATLQNLESEALSAGSEDDITTITNQYNSAQAQGQILGQNDVTNAQQDRTTLQSQLAGLNASTATGLQQCNAF